jgi:hypothetical protein
LFVFGFIASAQQRSYRIGPPLRAQTKQLASIRAEPVN